MKPLVAVLWVAAFIAAIVFAVTIAQSDFIEALR